MSVAELVFWIAIVLVGYSYVLYPLLLAALVRLLRLPLRQEALGEAGVCPGVACIIAAFNEERHISERIDNVLAQTYGSSKLTLYVGSDGSSDRTAELISVRKGDRVNGFVFEKNRGKASVLNDLVAASSEPILVFSDANTMFEPDAVARLVERFDDPKVGAVCGELKLLDAKGSNQDSAYWRIEQFLKRSEAKLGGLLGANGAIYALRREIYRPLLPDTITDDFCIAMTAAAGGWELVYQPRAVAVEETPDAIADEYSRRVRIGIGNYQAFFRHPEYLLRTNWATRFAYVSHKVLRWFTPHLMLAALAASALLAASSPFYGALLLLQLAAYAGAVLVWRFELDRILPRIVGMVYLLLTINWAFLVAFSRYVTGRYSGSWRTTARAFGRSGSTLN
jgi:cellulose synthase/poly-beta-1,6-N-acetylglucosamine synthase-like glycosyltransferase